MGGAGLRCITTRQLFEAAVAASAVFGRDCGGSASSATKTSATFPPTCATAFDRVCAHALSLLAHDLSDIGSAALQSEHFLFHVGMRNVTVTFVKSDVWRSFESCCVWLVKCNARLVTVITTQIILAALISNFLDLYGLTDNIGSVSSIRDIN